MSTGSTVYLLHFMEPIGNASNPRAMAQHYIGLDLNGHRLEVQTSGSDRAAKIVQHVIREGIGFVVAARYDGGPELEKRLKRRKDTPRWCPVCKQGLGEWLAQQEGDGNG